MATKRIRAGYTILLNTQTNTTFIASRLDEKVQTGSRENDQHIEWAGELSIKVYAPEDLAPDIRKIGEFIKVEDTLREYARWKDSETLARTAASEQGFVNMYLNKDRDPSFDIAGIPSKYQYIVEAPLKEKSPGYNCPECGGTSTTSTVCENTSCPNMPCCGNSRGNCKCK